ncbi:hypothetical protein HYU13_04550 [Candidatus Woesearchaeota archaeon]|nr:hypothetical protein [Candidatus Woesearchaeota archaeon]
MRIQKLIVLVCLVLLLASCSRGKGQASPSSAAQPADISPEISQAITEAENIDRDLATEDLDSIEQDIEMVEGI